MSDVGKKSAATGGSSNTNPDTNKLPLPAGLELAYLNESKNIRSAIHAFVLFIHWSIVRAGLRLRSNDQQQYTELLPEGWTSLVDQITQGKVILNYIDPITNETYEFKMVEVSPNDTIVVTVFRQVPSAGDKAAQSTVGAAKKETSSASTLRIASYVNAELFQNPETSSNRSASTIYKNSNELEKKIWSELFEPIGLHVLGKPPVLGPYEDKTKKTWKAEQQRSEPTIIDYDEPSPYNYPGTGPRPSPMYPQPMQPGGIGGPLGLPPIGGGLGRNDLDPLGRFGAGNVADPRGFRNPHINGPPMGIGPGQLPPGARFDPFGPPNPAAPGGTRPRPGNFGQINPDHEQPPPGFDDMFM